MKTIIVWILYAYASGYRDGGPIIIDDIASKQDCISAAIAMQNQYKIEPQSTHCISIRKAVK